MKRQLFLSFYILFVIAGYSAVPVGYYNSAEGKKAAALKTALHDIICQDTTNYLDYGSGKGKTWEGFYYTDRDMITNAVIDMYSPTLRYFPNPNPTFVSFGQEIHIEHSVPKSWWKCDISHPDCAAKDLNHLFPADGTTNMSKNDNPLGVVNGNPTTNNGVSKIGGAVYDGYVGNVFEPADQFKGDFARAYFYMATAYEHYANKWDTSKPENMMENNRYPVLKPWALALLLQWSRQDPVSLKEVTRNDVVYGIQRNRNPYIDHPELVEYIWGDKTTIPYRLDGSVAFSYLKWPSENDTINFKKVYYSHPKDTLIQIQAMNLVGDLSLAIGGVNASNFSLDKTTLTKEEAEIGTTFQLRYKALAQGDQSAVLTISGGGISTIYIRLIANTSDDFAALPASNATTSSFVAEWTASPGATAYKLDVYTLQHTGNYNSVAILEEEFALSFPDTWKREGHTEYASGTMRIASSTNAGKITTPALNLSSNTTLLTVRAKQYGSDAGAKITATIDNQPLAVWTTAVGNQDFTIEIPISTAASKIAFSAITGKRVYIDYVKAVSQVPIFAPITISTFPKMLGNVLSYTVTGLQSGKTYYYTVTPQGNDATVSNQMVARTTVNTSVKDVFSSISWTVSSSGIRLKDLPKGITLHLLDITGKRVTTFVSNTTEKVIEIPHKGIYLLQMHTNSAVQTVKIQY